MKVATGRVVEGKVVLEGEPLAEGAVVTVVARDDDDTFDVSHDEERALLDAIAQADRAQVVSWEPRRRASDVTAAEPTATSAIMSRRG